jgi:iron complex outermembrane receptor protein
MTYVTWSRGFRAGYYAGANFTLPERTTNYEVGVKSTSLDGRLTLNADIFHIDYTNQQYSEVINAPPYRISVNIPKTEIVGSEFESSFAFSRAFSLGASMGYLNARVDDGTRSPGTPKFTANLTADFVHPIGSDWNIRAHGDYRFSGAMNLGNEDTFGISSKHYTNLRVGVEDAHWRVALYGRNIFDTRQAMTFLSNLSGGWERDQNLPASYGIQITYVL